MAAKKNDGAKSFVAYYSWWDVLKKLDEHQQALILQAMFSTGGVCEKPELDFVADIAFIPMEREIRDNLEKWEKTREARREAGSKGGKARASNAKQSQANQANATFAKQEQAMLSNVKQSQANQAIDIDTDIDTDTDIDIDIDIDIDTAMAKKKNDDDDGFIPTQERVIHNGGVMSESEVIEMIRQKSDEQLAAARFDDMAAMYPDSVGLDAVTVDAKLPLLEIRLVDMGKAIRKHTSECEVCMTGGEWFAGGYKQYL